VHGIQAPTELIDSTTVFVNDAFGRLVSVVPPAGAAATYLYDEQDNLVEVQLTSDDDPPLTQPRRFVYDLLGRLRSATNSENGTVEYLAYDGGSGAGLPIAGAPPQPG